jgi:hypothetical protein
MKDGYTICRQLKNDHYLEKMETVTKRTTKKTRRSTERIFGGSLCVLWNSLRSNNEVHTLMINAHLQDKR